MQYLFLLKLLPDVISIAIRIYKIINKELTQGEAKVRSKKVAEALSEKDRRLAARKLNEAFKL